MKKNQLLIYLLLTIVFLQACTGNKNEEKLKLTSPKGKVEINFLLNDEGSPAYIVKFNNNAVIDTSTLGFDFKDRVSIDSNMKIIGSKTGSINETWEMPWGEQREVINKAMV